MLSLHIIEKCHLKNREVFNVQKFSFELESSEYCWNVVGKFRTKLKCLSFEFDICLSKKTFLLLDVQTNTFQR